jgi:hypothetical protein
MTAPAQTPEERAVLGIGDVHDEAQKQAAGARARLDRAAADLDAARAAYDAAGTALGGADAPDPKLAGAWHEAERSLGVAAFRQQAAAEASARADAALDTARTALEGAKLDARRAELRRAASPAELLRHAGAAWGQYRTRRDLPPLEDLEAALHRSHAAAAELSTLGEHTLPLSGWLAMAPCLESAARQGQGLWPVGADQMQFAPAPSRAVAWLILAETGARPWPADHCAGLLERLARLRASGARTMGELADLEARAARAAHAERLASYQPPAPFARSGRASAVGPGGYRVDLEDGPGGNGSQ